jgi:DNA (cytosine-5)-methyltransferase 1
VASLPTSSWDINQPGPLSGIPMPARYSANDSQDCPSTKGMSEWWTSQDWLASMRCALDSLAKTSVSQGGGAGINGRRSGLYREVMRAIDIIRPAWVFLENSPAIRTRGREVVIADLVARGYPYRDGTIAASDVGAPHRRLRWFCLARRTDANGVRESQPEGSQSDIRGRTGYMGQDVSDATSDEQHTAAGSDRSRGWWATEPGMGRVAHGVPHRSHRIKGLGNAQVPLQAAVAWRYLGGP